MAAVSPIGRAAGLEPLTLGADAHVAGTLYEHHSRQVFAYCLSKLGRREDAEDAVQTTFLHAVRGLKRGIVPTVELAWLLGIARNVCLSRRESAGRRGRLELVCDPVDLERTAARQGPRDELIGLEDALARLPQQQRRAVLLRDWRGLSYEEVAARLDVSLANAETLIFRGRRSLAALLQEQPSTTRRRLASLANVGSLLTAIKTAFTGATSVAKIAAAVGVVAASGAGVVAGTSALAESDRTPAVVPVTNVPARRLPAPLPKAATAPAVPAAPAPARGAAPERPRVRATPAPAAAPAAPSTPAATPDVPAEPTNVPPVAPPHATAPAPAPRPTVQSTVDQALPPTPAPAPTLPEVVGSLPLPPLPVEIPAVVETVVEVVEPIVAPVVEPVVAVLPTVTVTAPLLPVGPVTIDPRTLLP